MGYSNSEGCYIRPTYDGYGTEASPFRSILYAFWWFFTTATTVGYGDDYPTTTVGRIVGVVTFYTGIILLALPITIVASCFNQFYPDWVKEFGTEQQQLEHAGKLSIIRSRSSKDLSLLDAPEHPPETEPSCAWT